MKYKDYITTILIFCLLFPALTADAGSKSVENIFYYTPSEIGYESVKRNYKKIDILAPQIYTIGYDLKMGESESKDILKLAKKKRLKVMPLIVQANFDKSLMSQILLYEDKQDEIIDDLISEAKKRKFIGWQFDFENISHTDRDLYTDFVERAYKKFKKKKLKLSVAVIPTTKPYNKNDTYQDWSTGYNIPDIAEVSDFVSIMTYDDPNSIGPVASLPYVEKVLDYTLKETPAKKISLGVPLYCWQYQLGNPKKIASVTYNTSKNTQKKYKKNGVGKMYFELIENEIFYFLKDNGRVNYIWCDNEKSLDAKLDIIKDNKLRGFSAWAIGQESSKIWKKLK